MDVVVLSLESASGGDWIEAIVPLPPDVVLVTFQVLNNVDDFRGDIALDDIRIQRLGAASTVTMGSSRLPRTSVAETAATFTTTQEGPTSRSTRETESSTTPGIPLTSPSSTPRGRHTLYCMDETVIVI